MAVDIEVVINQKGGVGKSTCTYHLARSAARRGARVLVVDLDPQGNISSFLSRTEDGEPLPEDSIGLADVLSRNVPTAIDEVILPTIFEGVDLVPTTGETLDLVNEELTIAGAGRESRLRKALEAVSDQYDLFLIDCPPALNQLTTNGLVAAHRVIVVTESRMASANGLAKLLNTIDQIREFYNKDLVISGAIVNKHEAKTKTARHWLPIVEAAAERNGFTVLQPLVPKRAVIGDYPEHGLALDQGDAEAREFGGIFDQYALELFGGKR